jgi:hypothetical protein
MEDREGFTLNGLLGFEVVVGIFDNHPRIHPASANFWELVASELFVMILRKTRVIAVKRSIIIVTVKDR